MSARGKTQFFAAAHASLRQSDATTEGNTAACAEKRPSRRRQEHKLLHTIAAHIAITGGMAAGDSLIQQFLGHGIAAKLSARLGEGVLNGLLTARVGLSAMAVCRPLPFATKRPPGVGDVAPFLFKSVKKE